MRLRPSLAALVVALMLPAACRRASTSAAAVDDSLPAYVELTVDNHNWSDIVVSLEYDGKRTRIATVKSAAKQTLHIPSMWLGASNDVRLIAHRTGARGEYRSEFFSIRYDQAIDWTLESDLRLSTLAVR